MFLFDRYHFYLPDIELASGKENSSLSLVGFDIRWKELLTTFELPVKKRNHFLFFRNIFLFSINNIIFIYFSRIMYFFIMTLRIIIKNIYIYFNLFLVYVCVFYKLKYICENNT